MEFEYYLNFAYYFNWYVLSANIQPQYENWTFEMLQKKDKCFIGAIQNQYKRSRSIMLNSWSFDLEAFKWDVWSEPQLLNVTIQSRYTINHVNSDTLYTASVLSEYWYENQICVCVCVFSTGNSCTEQMCAISCWVHWAAMQLVVGWIGPLCRLQYNNNVYHWNNFLGELRCCALCWAEYIWLTISLCNTVWLCNGWAQVLQPTAMCKKLWNYGYCNWLCNCLLGTLGNCVAMGWDMATEHMYCNTKSAI